MRTGQSWKYPLSEESVRNSRVQNLTVQLDVDGPRRHCTAHVLVLRFDWQVFARAVASEVASSGRGKHRWEVCQDENLETSLNDPHLIA